MRQALLVSAFALVFPAFGTTSHAQSRAKGFVAVPKLDGKKMNLDMRFDRYNGGTNGAMVVTVRNDGRKTETFKADGLYFVPQGDPETAPQRLGASGPFEVVQGESRRAASKIALKPGQSVQLELQVFCIDSHRSSPSSENTFSIAGKRMPKKLRRTISQGTEQIIEKNDGKYKAPATKGQIQSHVWKSRDKKWIKLEGERKNEKAATPQRLHNEAPRVQQRRRHK